MAISTYNRAGGTKGLSILLPNLLSKPDLSVIRRKPMVLPNHKMGSQRHFPFLVPAVTSIAWPADAIMELCTMLTMTS